MDVQLAWSNFNVVIFTLACVLLVLLVLLVYLHGLTFILSLSLFYLCFTFTSLDVLPVWSKFNFATVFFYVCFTSLDVQLAWSNFNVVTFTLLPVFSYY